MREHWRKRITEAGGGKISKGGEEDVYGKKGMEEVVGEVIQKIRRDPELDSPKQRPLRCIADRCKSNPLPFHYLPIKSAHRNAKRRPRASAPPPTR